MMSTFRIKSSILFLLFILLTTLTFAQQSIYRKAVRELTLGYPDKALESINKGISKYPDYDKFYYLKAKIFYQSGAKAQAIEPLKKYYSLSHNPLALNELGHIYFELKNYKLSANYLQKYLATGKAKDSAKTLHMIEVALFRDYAYSHPVPYSEQKLPSQINTQWDEYFPDISARGKLFFTRRQKDENIFFSQKKRNTWTEAQPFKSINTRAQEGACSISPDGKIMIFTRCTQSDGCDLYITKYENGQWTSPQKLPEPINTEYWESQPCLANNGQTLYFVSNRPGGKGKLDIWVVDYIGDKWSHLRNLGDSINTPGNEMSPFLHFDNNTLYFASDYLPGMGGYDLFFSRYVDGHWTKPVNLGYPINTEKDDVRMVVTALGDTALFSSQQGGNHDIYQFKLYKDARPNPTLFLVGSCTDGATQKPLKAKISIVDLNTNKVYYTSNTDSFLISIPMGNFAFFAEKQGYTFESKNFSTLDTNGGKKFVYVNVKLYPIKPEQVIKLHNIFFETNSYHLKPESYVELEKVVRFLRNNPKIIVEISGHTDSIGTYEYNMQLSQKRAQAVADYLIKHGIAPNRLDVKGYGFTRPEASNRTEKGRRLNRRVEIKILKI